MGWPGHRHGWADAGIQVGGVLEDLGLQLLEGPARLDAELLTDDPSGPLIGAQGVALAPAAKEPGHQRRPCALAQRMVAHDGLGLCDCGRSLPGLEQGDQASLGGGQAELVQPGDLGLGELLVGEVGIRRPPPQRQCGLQRDQGGLGITRAQEADALGRQALEAHDVDGVRLHSQEIAGGLGREHVRAAPVGAGGLQEAPEPGDIGLQRCHGACRGLVTPELLDQPVDGHHPVGRHDQHREERPLLRAAQGEQLPAADDLERAQRPELDGRSVARPHNSTSNHTKSRPSLSGLARSTWDGRNPARCTAAVAAG